MDTLSHTQIRVQPACSNEEKSFYLKHKWQHLATIVYWNHIACISLGYVENKKVAKILYVLQNFASPLDADKGINYILVVFILPGLS